MSTHTPEPWFSSDTDLIIRANVNGGIMRVALAYERQDLKLIAAAPAMLELLKACVSVITTQETCALDNKVRALLKEIEP